MLTWQNATEGAVWPIMLKQWQYVIDSSGKAGVPYQPPIIDQSNGKIPSYIKQRMDTNPNPYPTQP